MRHFLIISLVMLSACSSDNPVGNEIDFNTPVPKDSTEVLSPPDLVENAVQPLPDLQKTIAVPLDSVSPYFPTQSLGDVFTDNNMFRNSERDLYHWIRGKWMYSEGSYSIVELVIDCSQIPSINLVAINHVTLPQGTNMLGWMTYHHADFGNEYQRLKPTRFVATAGQVEIFSSGYGYQLIQERNIYRDRIVVQYQIRLQNTVFEDGTGVAFLTTSTQSCYPKEG